MSHAEPGLQNIILFEGKGPEIYVLRDWVLEFLGSALILQRTGVECREVIPQSDHTNMFRPRPRVND